MRSFKHPILLLFVFGLVGATLSSCWRDSSWHEKITLTIDTPDGIRSAFSVLATTYEPAWLEGPAAGFDRPTITRRGEAVVMDMGDGRQLFALLKGLPDAWIVFTPGEGPADVAHEIENMRATKALVADQYPLLVTFDDINDPASVKPVDPDDLAATFGPGFRLVSITMSITDEPVTKGKVEEVLGWLIKVGNDRFYLDPNTPALIKDFSPEQLIQPSDFLSIDHWRK